MTQSVRARKRVTIPGAGVGYLIADATRRDYPIVYIDDTLLSWTGYTRAEILGWNCRVLQGPATEPAAIASLRAGVAAGRRVTVTITNHAKDGTPFRQRLDLGPRFDPRGQIQTFLSTHTLLDR